MKRTYSHLVLVAVAGLFGGSFDGDRVSAAEPSGSHAERPKFTAEQEAFFEKEVRPILLAKCVKCHGGEEKVASEFYLTSRAATIRGGELGPAVDLSKPEESQLLQAIRYEALEMPPSGRMPKEQVAILERWVREGLPWPARLESEPKHVAAKKAGVTDEDRKYWAYRPVVEPPVPVVKNGGWVRTPIDAFILAKLEERGLKPTTPAEARGLVRRAAYDLTGLPLTPEEVEEFVREFSPSGAQDGGTEGRRDGDKAYEALVDRLLASPHYGEKWGRHWLDLVRYAETHGYERDSAKPQSWRYRDYVVDSFNADKPYDLFLREQLAGDEFDQVTPETLTATGYYRLGIWDDEPADRELARYDIMDGVVATTSSVVLGMSVGCARCHDHKRDPIPQRDYYRLLACFRDVTDMNRDNLRRIATDADKAEYERRTIEKQAAEAKMYSDLYGIEQRFLAEARKQGIEVGEARGADLAEIRYRFYRDSWDALPEFDSLKAESSGKLNGSLISLEPATRREAIGFVYEAQLRVPSKGEYVFTARGRDGLRVIVGGKTIVDKPKRGYHEGEGRIELEAGLTPIRVEYFNGTQTPELRLAWSGPDFGLRPLSADAKPGERDDADTWAYSTQVDDKDWMKPEYSDLMWRRGKAGFGTNGTPGAKVGTEWKTKNIYLRRKFRLAALPERLALDLHHDEDVTIFLNGKKAYSAEGHLRKYERITLSAEASKLLKVGENTIAVYCKQTGGGQYIDVRMADRMETIEDFVRRYGEKVLGAAEAKRYVDLVERFNVSRRETIPAPGIDVMSVAERGTQPTHVLLRGLPAMKGDAVSAGVPEVLTPAVLDFAKPTARGESSGKRTQLAEWLTDPKNPLTARVIVNRVWQYHFGRGLVPSTNDFGKLGESPTHPELLDWLATDFVRHGWKFKRLHKLIMTSSVYRMSSRATEAGLATDAGNSLFWRFNMRRLAAEEVRDSILAASGQLDLRVGGPSVYPPIPAEVLAGQSRPGEGWPTSKGADAARRSVYVHVKRALQLPILATHDQADTDASCPARYVTTVPTQSLGMLNGEFLQEQAAAMAERLRGEASSDVAMQVRRAVALTTGRPATEDEVRRDAAFIAELQAKEKVSAEEALKLYCLLTLNANEFLYLD
jgi:cytochrome c553